MTFRAPASLDVSLAVPELREIIEWTQANPGSNRAALFAALAGPGASAERKEAVRAQFAFAVDRGNVVEYANGTLAVGAEHPLFVKPGETGAAGERQAQDAPDDAPAPEPAAEVPAPEPSAEPAAPEA